MANAVLCALLVAMDKWVSEGTEPPASRIPRVADGTLVATLPQKEQGFPHIPGIKYLVACTQATCSIMVRRLAREF